MGEEIVNRPPPSEPSRPENVIQKEIRLEQLQVTVQQVESSISMEEFTEYASFNPLALQKRFETLEKKKTSREEAHSTQKKEVESKKIVEVAKFEVVAKEFNRKNEELRFQTLIILKDQIREEDDVETIIQKVLTTYSDKWLADEAFDFLSQTSSGGLAEKVRAAKEQINSLYAREIKAGKNIALDAREFSRQGLGSTSALHNMYIDITGNPREAVTLFEELTKVFTFDKMKTVIDFLLHSLGSDLKSKGPSIPNAELQRLFSEARTLQGILSVFRFFLARMRVIQAGFMRSSLSLPNRLTFELLARQFIKLLEERYPSPEKVLLLSMLLGVSEETVAQIIIFTQFRDATRHVSPKFFKSEQHRQDVLASILDALSDLEDRLEEEEEKEEEEDQEPEEKE